MISRTSTSAPFFFFAALMVVDVVLVATRYSEAKGVSLEEMQQHLRAG